MSIALDPVSMLIDSAAHLWKRLEQHAAIEAPPQRGGLDGWLAGGAAVDGLDAAAILQLRRDYHRLCSLLDQLETLLRDGPQALAAVRARLDDAPVPLVLPQSAHSTQR